MIDLEDRRVLITGGSRGIGAECARMFARPGQRSDSVSTGSRDGRGLIDEISRHRRRSHI